MPFPDFPIIMDVDLKKDLMIKTYTNKLNSYVLLMTKKTSVLFHKTENELIQLCMFLSKIPKFSDFFDMKDILASFKREEIENRLKFIVKNLPPVMMPVPELVIEPAQDVAEPTDPPAVPDIDMSGDDEPPPRDASPPRPNTKRLKCTEHFPNPTEVADEMGLNERNDALVAEGKDDVNVLGPPPAPIIVETNNILPDAIFLKTTEKYPQIFSELKRMMEGELQAKKTGDYLKIQPSTEGDFLMIVTHFKERSYDYHLAAPPSSMPFRVAIKGLPTQTACSSISDELTTLGYNVIKVVQLTRRATKKPTKVFMAALTKNQGVNKILKSKVLLGLDILVEPYRTKHVPQCFQCNWFYHTSHTCHAAPRCLKCGDSHQTRQCLIGKLEVPTCINCHANGHVASNRRCPMYPKTTRMPASDRAVEKKPAARKPVNIKKTTLPSVSARSEGSPITELVKELVPIFNDTMGISELISLLREKESAAEKLQALFTFFLARLNETQVCSPVAANVATPTGQ